MKKNTFIKYNIVSDNNIVPHLHIVISDPDPEKNVMIVNLTTFYNTGREDNSCILQIGEHPFIKQKSYIPYHFAKEMNMLKLISEGMSKNIEFKENISDEMLLKIQNGAKKSDFLKPCFYKFFNYF